jgi:hypothetical protein
MQALFALSTTEGTVILAGLLIISATVMVVASLGRSDSTQKSVFGLAGVMIGLLSGGAIGTLSSTKAADNAANQVKTDVQNSVDQIPTPTP